MVNKDTVEKIVAERIEQFEQGKVVGEAKSRALNLKLRGASQQPNQNYMMQESQSIGQQSQGMSKEDMESLKLEMIREMRDMKQSMKDANQSNYTVL